MKRIYGLAALLLPVAALVAVLFGLEREGNEASFLALATFITIVTYQARDFFYLRSIDPDLELEAQAARLGGPVEAASGVKLLPISVDRALPEEDREGCGPPNASCYSVYPNRRILFEGEAFELLNGEEIKALIAHEHAHFVARHNWTRVAMRMAFAAAAMVCVVVAVDHSVESSIGLLGVAMLGALWPFHVYRQQEYEADQMAAKWVGSKSLHSAISKVAVDGPSFPFGLLRTHPATSARLKRLEGDPQVRSMAIRHTT